MPEKKPAFSSKSIDDSAKAKKKVVRKRKPVKKISTTKVKKVKPIVKKRVVRRKIKPKKIKPSIQEEKIEEQLSTIYKDNYGKIPNMKKIRVRRSHPIVKFFFSLIVVGGLLAAIAWAGFFVLPNNNSFSENKVKLSIEGPKKITLGATTTYIISYANNQNTNLENAVLTVQYPKGFVFKQSIPKAENNGNTEWKLGTITPNEKKNISITGLTYGSPKNEESWRVFLTYKPEKFNYKAQKMSTLNVSLNKNPFVISISGPDKATLGNDVEYKIKLENKDKNNLGKVSLKPNWSTQFFISTSTPAVNKNNEWLIDTGTSTYVWQFNVKGRYTSTTEKKSSMQALLNLTMPNGESYELDKKEIKTQLEQNNLKLTLGINGKTKDFQTKPGDTLNYSIFLKNSSSNDLKNIKVELEIDAPSANNRSVMDWANVKDKNDGDIIGTQLTPTIRRGEIIWYKKYIEKLGTLIPNDSVDIDVTLPIRDINKFDLTELKNYEIEISAQASYEDKNGETKTLSSNPFKIIINSDFELETRDTKSTEDGKERHSIKWILTNNFHELKDITVSADVYGKTNWQLEGKAPAGKVDYDKSKQQITWKIDKMPLAVDTLALPFSVTMQEKNPSQQILISKVKVEATDTITKQKIELIGDEVKLK
jgi:hypothetical protein